MKFLLETLMKVSGREKVLTDLAYRMLTWQVLAYRMLTWQVLAMCDKM